ncbi:MAG TPA: GON domain-containing protein [Amycolatopsis sp.]|uniref:GON domain-containing protein n=1 Tax=Amycolatopsis sp. TaxID=37632 RepID=UPI002B474302|nr:GON domain-containing protein [Amycolatopsis sp.]HKS47229.1 GON domain-containing protein [Amycolatopsis sp.]
MKRRGSGRSAFLLALLASLLALGALPAHADPVTWLFTSCQDVRTHILRAPDGEYVLSNSGRVFTVYCHDMAGTPREYIDLTGTGPNTNFSQYTAGGAAPGTDVRTTFTKLRVDPATLTVDIGDLTFASSTGSLLHGGQTVTGMPYGVAMSCVGPNNAAGAGNIDLRNTPYQVANAFVVGGFAATGSATVSPDNQVINLRGGGYCGWVTPAPAMYNPFNPSPGNYHLKLACAPTAPATPQRPFCVNAA